jgi:malonyl-CoA O-methyltransferase
MPDAVLAEASGAGALARWWRAPRYTEKIMLRPTGLERATVRAAFNERPAARAQADFLFREIERRMLERLDLIRLQPVDRVLDVGCGSGHSLATLAVRYPRAQMIGLDFAERTVAAAAGRPGPEDRLREGARRWLSRLGVGGSRQLPATMPLWMVADAHALAVTANSIDMVWSNLVAHWFDDPLAAVAEWHRVIRPDGLLMFSAFGVDTLKEVRQPRTAATTAGSHGPTYQDMHDWGDALSAAGFADPVMDVERLTLTYEDPEKFWSDARSLSMKPDLGQPAGQSNEPGTRSLSVEVIYGHAWCPAVKRRPDGLATVQFHAPGASYNRKR